MKRLASLIAVVFAFAIVPVALADDRRQHHPGPGRENRCTHRVACGSTSSACGVDLVHLRYRIVCHDPGAATSARSSRRRSSTV